MVLATCVYVQYCLMRDLKVEKLCDEFGQYLIYLCCECGHERRCYPRTLAAVAGWDAKLDDVARRMRCSKCNQKNMETIRARTKSSSRYLIDQCNLHKPVRRCVNN